MAFQNFPGTPMCYIGADFLISPSTFTNAVVASGAAICYIGEIVTADGGSHTLDTTGSSSIQWECSSAAFSSGTSVFKVGVSGVDQGNGPPGRPVNSSGVVTFDVSKTLSASGSVAAGWNTSVPDTGSKTIANGDLVAISFQLVTRGGSDAIILSRSGAGLGVLNRPAIVTISGATFTGVVGIPNAVITFSDGTLGWFNGGNVYTSVTAQNFQSGSSPNERGQLFQLPFPVRVFGAYGLVAAAISADFNVILYSDPLGTPVARRTEIVKAATLESSNSGSFLGMFSSPYDFAANQPFAVVVAPQAAANVTAPFKTMNSAALRVTDVWGTSGYGVNRSGGAGAFAQQNSGLDHYFLGVLASAFQQPASPTLALGF